jgi:hypothetical protein
VSAANGAAGWQHLADQLFQALGRTAGNDPALVSAVQILERVVAGQLLLAQPTSDNLDAFNWDDAGSELDWRAVGQSVLSGPGDRRDSATQQIAPAAAGTDVVTLDQLFAQDADDTDLVGDE